MISLIIVSPATGTRIIVRPGPSPNLKLLWMDDNISVSAYQLIVPQLALIHIGC